MARRVALVGISLLLSASPVSAMSACADAGERPAGAQGTPSSAAAFEARAKRVAQAWRDAGGTDQWRKRFVPLEDLTVPPKGATFNEATKQAFTAGWYRLATGMPREKGGRTGTVRYPDGSTATVPLITLAEAYGALDQGDPPPCKGPTIPPAADAPGADLPPESPVADPAPKPCLALTVTGITLGEVDLLTSRGRAKVPAWLFAVRELGATVARVAVAQSAIAPAPELKTGELPDVPGLVAAQDLTGIEGTGLAYRLGVGACDENIKPLVYEAADVVVVAGTANRVDKVCTEQLILHPARVELSQPVGTRPVLDGMTGRILTIPATAPR